MWAVRALKHYDCHNEGHYVERSTHNELVAYRSLFKTATPPSPTDRPTDRPAEPTGQPSTRFCPLNYTPYHLLVQNLAHITVHFLFVLSYTQVLGARNEFQ